MGWEAWLTLAVVVGCFAMMALTISPPDIIMSGGLIEVIITGTGRKRTHTLKLTAGPGDDMEPVITITLPK